VPDDHELREHQGDPVGVGLDARLGERDADPLGPPLRSLGLVDGGHPRVVALPPAAGQRCVERLAPSGGVDRRLDLRDHALLEQAADEEGIDPGRRIVHLVEDDFVVASVVGVAVEHDGVVRELLQQRLDVFR